MLAVRLHGELLKISREALQVLIVRKDGDGLGTEKVGVPDGEQTEQRGEVLLKRRRAEVLVHGMKARQHGAKLIRTDGDHGA